MFQLLSDMYTDPAEKEQATEDFRALVMLCTQPFFEFKMEFLRLAGLAEVPLSCTLTSYIAVDGQAQGAPSAIEARLGY